MGFKITNMVINTRDCNSPLASSNLILRVRVNAPPLEGELDSVHATRIRWCHSPICSYSGIQLPL